MVRALNVFVVTVALVGVMAGCAPHGTKIDPPPGHGDERIMRVTTAYAYEPEMVAPPPFDKAAAREALALVDVTGCGAAMNGHAKVTFAPNGAVVAVNVDWPNDLAPPVRECVRGAFAKVRVGEFDAPASVTLGTTWRARR